MTPGGCYCQHDSVNRQKQKEHAVQTACPFCVYQVFWLHLRPLGGGVADKQQRDNIQQTGNGRGQNHQRPDPAVKGGALGAQVGGRPLNGLVVQQVQRQGRQAGGNTAGDLCKRGLHGEGDALGALAGLPLHIVDAVAEDGGLGNGGGTQGNTAQADHRHGKPQILALKANKVRGNAR